MNEEVKRHFAEWQQRKKAARKELAEVIRKVSAVLNPDSAFDDSKRISPAHAEEIAGKVEDILMGNVD